MELLSCVGIGLLIFAAIVIGAIIIWVELSDEKDEKQENDRPYDPSLGIREATPEEIEANKAVREQLREKYGR